jgi:hypothetical protein
VTNCSPSRPVRGALPCLILLLFAPFSTTAAGESAAAETDVALAAPAAAAAIQPVLPLEDEQREPLVKRLKPERPVRYSRRGLEIGSEDGAFRARVNVRSQLRFSSPFADAPRREKDFSGAGDESFGFNRARFKVEGHVGKPWLEYKYEHDLVGNRLLDARFTLSKWDWLQVSAGQWKAEYSRERVDSSGRQQFAERSIVNRAFTIDRQKGVMVHGRVGEGSWWDSQYFSGVFTGNGRGLYQRELTRKSHEDGGALWVNRLQWNAAGGGVGFSQSDVERTETPAVSIAVASARNRSRYTRFSSSGGGQLDGFGAGEPGQYSIRQELAEVAFKYRGFSTQNEYHWKRVRDNLSGRMVPMRGAVVQGGYFLHEAWRAVPRQLEIGARRAFVAPDTRASGRQREIAVVANWFFEGHDNKLTVDVSRYSLARDAAPDMHDLQVRTQWEYTF